jgi:hypothetical protein
MALAALALLAPAPLLACGHCVEDRVAMVYDHGVVAAARDGNRRMAFYGIEGASARLAQAPGAVARALAPVRGVDAKSLRISLDALALSFSHDPRTTAAQLSAALDPALAPLGLRAVPLEGFTAPPPP